MSAASPTGMERSSKKRKLSDASPRAAVVPSAAPGMPTVTAPATGAPYIHPSRLAAPALRRADQRAKTRSSTGAITAGPKTKAKERYLRAKKERQKKKKKALAAPKTPGQGEGKLLNGLQLEGLEKADAEEANERARRLREKREKRELREQGRRKQKEQPVTSTSAAHVSPALNGKTNVAQQKPSINGPAGVSQEANNASPEADSDSSESDDEDDSSSSSSSASSDHPSTPDLPTHLNADSLQPVTRAFDADSDGAWQEEDAKSVHLASDEDPDGPALSRFPRARRTQISDPRLLSTQGLPEGLVHPVVVDPSLRQAIDSDPSNDKARKKQSGEERPEAPTDERAAGVLQLVSTAMVRRLDKLGIKEWFAVQTTVIPLLLVPNSSPLYPSRLPDLCVSAPTGSGKTLAYAVPIIEVLRPRILKQLRALIILPTRDLVTQVRETMQSLAKGSGLSIGSVTGQQSFAHEQAQLVDSEGSRLDILIATPGRLLDHLSSTRGFNLHHLRFLVVDEADRLLNQSFQEWLPRLMDALDPKSGNDKQAEKDIDDDENVDAAAMQQGDEAVADNLEAPAWLQLQERKEGIFTDVDEPRVPSVQKLLFSATLTRDPSHIAALGLRNPRYVSVQEERTDGRIGFEQTTLPATLREHMLVTPTSLKPLYLLHLLHAPTTPISQALCFTKSVDSSARLVKLIEYFEEKWAMGRKERQGSREAAIVDDGIATTLTERTIRVRDFSSDLTPAQRGKILGEFKDGQIDLLVCSDLMARGMDLPHVSHVISYDAPVDLTKYVHRVGRTARAGREGEAWSLVEEQEARFFKRMHAKAGRQGKVKKEKLPKDKDMEAFRPAYDAALERLSETYKQSS